MTEGDWKIFRRLHSTALERFSAKILVDLQRIASDAKKSSHERYVEIWKVLNKRDDQMARAFDDVRRSTALQQLCIMYSLKLITDDELGTFSPQTQEGVRFLFR
jgi:hypothetical protein